MSSAMSLAANLTTTGMTFLGNDTFVAGLPMTSEPNDVMTHVDCLVAAPAAAGGVLLNPEDLVSDEVRAMAGKVVSRGLLTFLFLVGCPANLVNMIVFHKQGFKERINVCLFTLSLVDFLVLALHFFWTLDWLVQEMMQDFTKFHVYRFFMNNNIIVLAGFIYVSNFLSMVIAVDRCYCVVSPFKARDLVSARTTAIALTAATLVIVGGHFPLGAQWRVVCLYNPLSGLVQDALYTSPFYRHNKELVQTMDGVIFGFLIPGVCLFGVIISTVITVLTLKRVSAWRGKSTSASAASSTLTAQDVALTRMLIGISVLYIACTTPAFLFHAGILVEPELSLSGKYRNTFRFLISVQQALTFINSSVNVIVYYVTGSRYRKTLGTVCGCISKFRKGGKKEPEKSEDTRVTSLTSSQ